MATKVNELGGEKKKKAHNKVNKSKVLKFLYLVPHIFGLCFNVSNPHQYVTFKTEFPLSLSIIGFTSNLKEETSVGTHRE